MFYFIRLLAILLVGQGFEGAEVGRGGRIYGGKIIDIKHDVTNFIMQFFC